MAAQAAAHRPSRRVASLASFHSSGGAPAGAPGPAASPAAKQDNWAADTHADEFGKEYIHHTREGLREPHVGDKAWMSEMHANPANFDPHGEDFLTERRSPVIKAGAVGGQRLAVLAGFVAVAAILGQ